MTVGLLKKSRLPRFARNDGRESEAPAGTYTEKI